MKHHLNLLATPPSCLTKKKVGLWKLPSCQFNWGASNKCASTGETNSAPNCFNGKPRKKKNDVISGTAGWSQPTNQKDFGLKGFGKNSEKTLQTSKEKSRRWKERHYFWDEVEIMRLVPRKLLNSLLLTQEVSFLLEKKVHQAILIHRSKPNWIHQSNFRVCFLKKPSLPNHHWPWDPTWAPYTSTTFWQKKASI